MGVVVLVLLSNLVSVVITGMTSGIWATLNGHEAGNGGYSLGLT